MGNIFDLILINPLLNALVALYQLFFKLGVPYALGFAIIAFTIVIRLVLSPLTRTQLEASHKMQKINPHMQKLREKHKGDAQRLQKEMMLLYKEHGVNPAAGCLPLILQFPILIALYSVLQKVVAIEPQKIVSEINKIVYDVDFLKLQHGWDTSFFGIPLGQKPSELFSAMPLILLLPIITAGLQFVQSKMMTPPKTTEIVKKSKEDDFSTVLQSQFLYLMPLMIGFFSFQFPVGLSLYWNTFTVFGILQQYQIQKKAEALEAELLKLSVKPKTVEKSREARSSSARKK